MKKIDLKVLKLMLVSGANNLYNHHSEVDKLNVFPVPDGDTGTNMNLTMMNGIKELNGKEYDNFKEFGATFSRGLIMGARGNSGVILSQIFRGFFNNLTNSKTDSKVETLKPAMLLKAFKDAKEFAYKAVMKPVEGTILTVIKDGAKEIEENYSKEQSPVVIFEKLLKAMEASLKRTPELLPILKKVGVVDSGGAGLVFIFDGMLYALKRNKVITINKRVAKENKQFNFAMEPEPQEFGYCTEVVVELNKIIESDFNINKIKSDLEAMDGQSIVVVEDQNLIKMHVHTLEPGKVLNYMQKYGEFLNTKIENMSQQAKKHMPTIKMPRKLVNDYALIACVNGKGIEKFFKEELKVNATIVYSKRINPSTDDFLKAIEQVDAKTVYILPNDSNLQLTAQQATKLERKSNVYVLPAVNIAQGMRAALSFNSSLTAKENFRNMNSEIRNVAFGYISVADRDVDSMDGIKVTKNNYISAIMERKNKKLRINFSHEDFKNIVNQLFAEIIWNSAEIVTIFKGKDVTKEQVHLVTKILDENFDVEYEFVSGQQEVYNMLFVVE